MLDPATQHAYRNLAAWIAERIPALRPCPVIGINGSQGSGKSTLVRILCEHLRTGHGLRAAPLAIDDFYLPRAARELLATSVHPLLLTRGVPGTHDAALGRAIIDSLRAAASGASIALPHFSKARDDRSPESAWPVVEGPFDVILFEGWCVGTPAQDARALIEPVNTLEAQDDADGRWRRRANACLSHDYAEWFAQIDCLVFLQVPDFDSVRRWRWQQETETSAAHRGESGPAPGLMTQAQLDRFLQHYQRLTEHALRTLPPRADALLVLNADHAVTSVRLGRVEPDGSGGTCTRQGD